ncbi:sigma-54 interaction domain-containing protein [Cupriavidus metallidurans]|uniref:sigma-54 interaction domain-containing protein n=1 Tax=Cupriavidus metallidurans TaxID=119219 RepID=UPI000CE05FC9|nr:sigma 54-interacting transcriptional regulator [Cupriavidus metallidurans]AVA35854.1 sigma-54-dependent Fis family transcriptional regulator [Cupriavidus metallidurans]
MKDIVNTESEADTPPTFWRQQEMLLLEQVMALVGRSLSPDVVMREMLHLLSELLGLNRGRVVLRDEDADTGSIRFAYGLTKKEIARGVYELGDGITGRVLATGQLTIVQDIDHEPRFLLRAVERAHLPAGPVSFIALPIKIEQQTIGVLACHRIRTRNRALSDDLTILRILATLAGQLLQLQASLKAKTRILEQRNEMLSRALQTETARYGIIGTAPPLLKAISELERVSDATASVLLIGDSGTGKELFARALHLASPRREKPFIKINCAAIPDTLFESELFGYERGAFTGANAARAGLFEQASAGTIFLDEIGELPLAMQSKLLRTLQEGTITRLGGKREISIDVRLVAATNRDLERGVAQGFFRQDLYYRLNVIPIQLPSLADRREDIPALVLHFLNHVNQAHQRNVNLTQAAISRLQEHDWPGNIRELSNLIERLVLLADEPFLDAADIARYLPRNEAPAQHVNISGPVGSWVKAAPAPVEPSLPWSGSGAVRPYLTATSHSEQQLRETLAQCGGNKSRAAQMLGLTVRQFAYRWQKLGLGR